MNMAYRQHQLQICTLSSAFRSRSKGIKINLRRSGFHPLISPYFPLLKFIPSSMWRDSVRHKKYTKKNRPRTVHQIIITARNGSYSNQPTSFEDKGVFEVVSTITSWYESFLKRTDCTNGAKADQKNVFHMGCKVSSRGRVQCCWGLFADNWFA